MHTQGFTCQRKLTCGQEVKKSSRQRPSGSVQYGASGTRDVLDVQKPQQLITLTETGSANLSSFTLTVVLLAVVAKYNVIVYCNNNNIF